MGVMVLKRNLSAAFKAARFVLVAADDGGLTDRLRRMGVGDVCHVSDPETARWLCSVRDIDACIVVLPAAVPDERPGLTAESAAPGGLPALLVADVVTPHVRRAAQRAGYRAAIPRGLPSMLLCRRLAALLQAARRAGAAGSGAKTRAHARSAGGSGILRGEARGTSKLKLQ
jgi:hypothetical protein